jgi:DNA-binding transcriptional LysR family regulator
MKNLGVTRNVVLTVPHFLGLINIVPQTDLIAMIAIDLAPAFERQSGMAVYPLPFPAPQVEVTQIWHKRYHKDPANQWLRALVRKALN